MALYQPAPQPPCGADRRVQALPWGHETSSPEHDPVIETPSLSDEERAERLRRLMERVFSPDGLDRSTLEHIEQLTGEDS